MKQPSVSSAINEHKEAVSENQRSVWTTQQKPNNFYAVRLDWLFIDINRNGLTKHQNSLIMTSAKYFKLSDKGDVYYVPLSLPIPGHIIKQAAKINKKYKRYFTENAQEHKVVRKLRGYYEELEKALGALKGLQRVDGAVPSKEEPFSPSRTVTQQLNSPAFAVAELPIIARALCTFLWVEEPVTPVRGKSEPYRHATPHPKREPLNTGIVNGETDDADEVGDEEQPANRNLQYELDQQADMPTVVEQENKAALNILASTANLAHNENTRNEETKIEAATVEVEPMIEIISGSSASETTNIASSEGTRDGELKAEVAQTESQQHLKELLQVNSSQAAQDNAEDQADELGNSQTKRKLNFNDLEVITPAVAEQVNEIVPSSSTSGITNIAGSKETKVEVAKAEVKQVSAKQQRNNAIIKRLATVGVLAAAAWLCKKNSPQIKRFVRQSMITIFNCRTPGCVLPVVAPVLKTEPARAVERLSWWRFWWNKVRQAFFATPQKLSR